MHEAGVLMLASAIELCTDVAGGRAGSSCPCCSLAGTPNKTAIKDRVKVIHSCVATTRLFPFLHFEQLCPVKRQVFIWQAKVLLPLTIKVFPDILYFITPTSIPCSTLNSSSSRHKARLAINYSTNEEVFNLLDKWFSVRWQATIYGSTRYTNTTSSQQVLLLAKQ